MMWTNAREGEFVRKSVKRAEKKRAKGFKRGGKDHDSCSPEI